jgi:hypothetical protein
MKIKDIFKIAKKKETLSDWLVFLILYIPFKILGWISDENVVYFDDFSSISQMMVVSYTNKTNEVKKCRFLGFNLFYNDKFLGNEEGVEILNLQGSSYAHSLSEIANSKNDITINKIRLVTDNLKNYDQTILLTDINGWGLSRTIPFNLNLISEKLKNDKGYIHREILDIEYNGGLLSGNKYLEFNIEPNSRITISIECNKKN